MRPILNVLCLPMYSRIGASSRLRMLQYYPLLNKNNIRITNYPLCSDEMLVGRYRSGRYNLFDLFKAYLNRIVRLVMSKRYDLIWIEKEALPWLPLWFELGLLNRVPYVLDFDDAVFHKYDLHPSKIIRYIYGIRIDSLMSRARLVIVGNTYLASRAHRAGAKHIEIVPTVIDLNRYRVSESSKISNKSLKIVWIGSPSTVKYLLEIALALQTLTNKFQFTLCVIGATIDIPGLDIECIPWSEHTEVDAVMKCDIGIMPLSDSPWELGKCGYKLIQYMACAIPVVASPVGVNISIVRDGFNGFLANGIDIWVDRLGKLLSNRTLRTDMGICGRKDVEDIYCIQHQGPRLSSLLRNASDLGQ